MKSHKDVSMAILFFVMIGCLLISNSAIASEAEFSQIKIKKSDDHSLQVEFIVDCPSFIVTDTKAGKFLKLDWQKASQSGEIGEPSLPVVRKLFIVPFGAKIDVDISEGQATIIDLKEKGFTQKIIPVQPPIEKIQGAVERARFHYNPDAYASKEYRHVDRVIVKELGVVRGQRVFLLEIRPVSYNPAMDKIAFWPDLSVAIYFKGSKPHKPKAAIPGLSRIVTNPEILPSESKISGNYLIIVASAFETAIEPFAIAKEVQGFTVVTYSVSAGTSSITIKDYIQGLWNTADAPDYILLVGDTNTIPHWVGQGDGAPNTDLPYTCMDGVNDWYPDIAIGRFPVRTATQLANVIEKTLEFESSDFADHEYVSKGVFMASEDNYAISEGTHNWVISNYMTPYEIASNKLYSHTYNATTQQVRDAFNDGRLYGIYSGHGGEYYWADGPAFYQSDINNLTNESLYPLVLSFACITGSYHLEECFTETWLLAEDKGAVAVYGSSVNSYWTEDDQLEKDVFRVLFDDDIREVGDCWNAARMRYLSVMGSSQTTRRYFEMYNLMGDPSLYLPMPTEPTGLKVSPRTDFAAEGAEGGPFSPESVVYTIENLNETGIDYTVTADESWILIDNVSGYLEGYDTTQVAISIGEDANDLSIGEYTGTINFENMTDHDGDTARDATLVIGVPTVQYSWNMDEYPGWDTTGQWAWGQPAGIGGEYGNPDPESGYTGSNVYGYNLEGDYGNSIPEYSLTTRAINCSNLSRVSLQFQRWLGVESNTYDHATIQVSNDKTNWTEIWANPSSSTEDSSWVLQSFDISDIADAETSVFVRWTIGPTDSSWRYCGWNIDDVEITAVGNIYDLDGDGSIGFGDLAIMRENWLKTDPNIPGDFHKDDDDIVNLRDFAEFAPMWKGQ